MKHFGKTIKKYHYIPLLDDRNINDQGIDATGISTANQVTIDLIDPAGVAAKARGQEPTGAVKYAVGKSDTAANALTAAKVKFLDICRELGITIQSPTADDGGYAATVTALKAAGWDVVEHDAVNGSGNFYGSSKDVGTIQGKLPSISEQGGRVNRVGFTRVTLEGTIDNFGFFDEYTEDSLQFDNDSELMSHISRETLRAANEIVEDMIQIDLLNGANVVFYGGTATSMSELTGESSATTKSVLDYDTLVKLEATLDDNLCPKDTKIITGSRMTDTKTIGATRYAYVGAELKPTLLKMKDYHNQKAFVPIEQYAEAGKVAHGEIGTVAGFHFIEVPKMLHWDAKGATVSTNGGYRSSTDSTGTEKYNVYPMLVVGSGCFTTIGFQTSGDNAKFKILHKAPGSAMADRHDPYGKMGFYSIQWWYGSMVLRPEWLACVKVVAER